MAAPHVSGLIALILKRNPQLHMQNIRYLLEQTGDPSDSDPGKPIGKRINAYTALNQMPLNAKKATLIINNLKILDCDDDDEDMFMRIIVFAEYKNGNADILFDRILADVHVEEEHKIGNDSRCTFFGGLTGESALDLKRIHIDLFLKTNETSDGLNWGGLHRHTLEVENRNGGLHKGVLRKQDSNIPNSQGVYELSYSLIVYCQQIEGVASCPAPLPEG